VPGGFAVQLPKDLISQTTPKAWTYRSITSEPTYVLEGQDGFTTWEIQLDCHGNTMDDAIVLARAIDSILRGGFRGILSDPDRTVVQGIFRQGPLVDGFSDSNRTYVRTLEYRIEYNQV
jgi:hypothetical protein